MTRFFLFLLFLTLTSFSINVVGCEPITASGNYNLTTNVAGTNRSASPLLGNACIIIAANHVNFSCQGFNITDNGSTVAPNYGILVNISATNITIRDCPYIADYQYGIYLHEVDTAVITNNTLYNVSQGFVLNRTNNTLIYFNTIATNASGSIGPDITGGHGFEILNSINNTVTNNTINTSGNGDPSTNIGILVNRSSNFTTILNNTIRTNGTINSSGIWVERSNNVSIVNNTISTKGSVDQNDGITIHTDSLFINVTGNNISTFGASLNVGIRFRSGVNNSVIANNTINSSGSGNGNSGIILFNLCNYNVISGNNIQTGSLTASNSNARGIQVQNSSFNNITNNIVNTSGAGAQNHGIYVFNLSNDTYIFNNSINVSGTNSNNGIMIHSSGSTVVLNNTIYTHGSGITNTGIRLFVDSHNVNITGNAVFPGGSTGYGSGIRLDNISSGSTIKNNSITTRGSATNNHGIFLGDYIFNTTIMDNWITVNGTTSSHGIYLLNDVNNNTIVNNTIILNVSGTSHGIAVYGAVSTTRNMSNNIIQNNNITTRMRNNSFGIVITGAPNTSIGRNLISNFSYGIFINKSDNNTIFNNTIFNNTDYGIFVNGSNNTVTNNTLSNNNVGIQLNRSFNTTLLNNTVSKNNGSGITIFDSNITFIQFDRLFNNSIDLLINGTDISINLSNIIFDNPFGILLQNYTNLSLNDTVSGNTTYFLNWTIQPPASLPSNRISFRETYLNISNLTGSAQIDQIRLFWSEADLGGYTENNFELWRYNTSGWLVLSDSANITHNFLSLNNVLIRPYNIFAVLQNAVTASSSSGSTSSSSFTISYSLVCPLILEVWTSTSDVLVRLIKLDPYEGEVATSFTTAGKTNFTLPGFAEYEVDASKIGYTHPRSLFFNFSYDLCTPSSSNSSNTTPVVPSIILSEETNESTQFVNGINDSNILSSEENDTQLSTASILADAKREIQNALFQNKNTLAAEDHLQFAEQAFAHGDYRLAQQFATEALLAARSALPKRVKSEISYKPTEISSPSPSPIGVITWIVGGTLILLVGTAILWFFFIKHRSKNKFNK